MTSLINDPCAMGSVDNSKCFCNPSDANNLPKSRPSDIGRTVNVYG